MTPQHQPVHKPELTREPLGDRTVIPISGDPDIAAPSTRERLRVALRDTGAHVIIDLAGVTRCAACSSVTEARTAGPGIRSAAA